MATTDREKQKQYHTTITVPNLDAISVAIATIYMTVHFTGLLQAF
jgi:hypothetical protein